ncbi:PucR family transcriptional regulator [Nocardia sp. NPDC057668]|uniref:PucR family transcriptional regulator n=1 Tax=Nocardia sp. NPDC057668 TaxID=3346202 RepID=UPI00366F047D
MAEWARAGVRLESIQHAIHAGFGTALRELAAHTGPSEFPGFTADADRAVTLLGRATTTVSLVYLAELENVLRERRGIEDAVAAALLAGHGADALARECGMRIAESYCVLALRIPAESAGPDHVMLDAARQAAGRLQRELATRRTDGILTLIGSGGGTVLIPSPTAVAGDLNGFLAGLTGVAGVPLTAICAPSAVRDIPDVAGRAHELLNLIRQVRSAPGLYRFEDLALEYQLTRPGPARRLLATLLDPLDPYPDLLETLRVHLANELNRRRTARQLHIHANTIDYRLQRIKQLTGLDPAVPSALWHLRSALIARSSET